MGLEVVPLRGNVDTRLRQASLGGELDAVVLALAGLRRLGRDDEVTEILDPIQLLPAPAQGALAVECRAPATTPCSTPSARSKHPDTRTCRGRRAGAAHRPRSRLFGARSGRWQKSPTTADGSLEVFLRGSVTAVDGSDAVRLSATGPTTDAEGVGRRLAADLIANGAEKMMGSSS